jgi:predicted DNA-binding transcriptional regulator AlpA
MDDLQDIQLLTPKQVSQILACSLPQVYKLANEGEFPCYRRQSPNSSGKNKSRPMVRFLKKDIMNHIKKYYTG